MFKFTILLSALVATCLADGEVKCGGEFPQAIFHCLGNPTVIPKDVLAACFEFTDPCERNKCTYRKLGWLDGDVVKKDKVGEFYEGLAVTYPNVFGPAIDKLKAKCLTADLKALSSYPECPYYDIMLCSITTVFRNALPSAWQKSESCDAAKKFVETCPICPKDCVGSNVPEGVCKICKAYNF